MEVDNEVAKRNTSADAADQTKIDTIRIFVGGLGEGVSDEDLRRMFVALGSVDEIEIIRSKERSIAYLNFTPSSAKSLAKLFSSFNGCVWKGGRLRIEKAKEHYLDKMEKEREREREEEIARNDAAMKRAAAADVVSVKKPSKGPGAEKEQVRIFFPKLRKVKPLPFSGCGKHKYSFRNIPVPPLPIHFCDCELHYVPYDAPLENGEVNKKEFDLMESVLNNLLSRDENSSVKAEGPGPNGSRGPYSVSDDILALDDTEPNSEPDEDGIILNISGAMKETDFSWSNIKVSEKQEPNSSHLRVLEADDKKLPNSDKKRKLGGESNETSIHSLKRRKDDLNALFTQPIGSSSSQSKTSKWKELVGAGSDNSFKLSNVLPRGAQESAQQEDTDNESSKSEDLDDETEASDDESMQDTEEESSKSEEFGDEAEELADQSGKSDTEEESARSEEPDDVVEEESADELAEQDTEDESYKLEEYDEEVVNESIDGLEKQEDTEDESNKFEESDDETEKESGNEGGTESGDNEVDEESIDALAKQEDTEDVSDKVEESDDEVEEDCSDDLVDPDSEDKLESENVAEESLDEVEEQDNIEEESNNVLQPVTKSEENKQQEGVKLTDTEDGSVKKGATWTQIMPWTQLVSDLGNSSFSISQILSGSNANQVAAKPSPGLKDIITHQSSSKAVKAEVTPLSDGNFTNSTTDLHEQSNLATKGEEEKPPTTRVDSASKSVVKAVTYDNRPFVRSDASLKEWKRLKETLRKSRTKKKKSLQENGI